MAHLNPVGGLKKTSVWTLLIASTMLAFFTCVSLRQVNVPDVGFAVFLITCLGWLAVILSGVFTQKMLGSVIEDPELTFAVAAGIVSASLTVLGLAELFQISAASGFVVFGVSVLLLSFWCRKHFTCAFQGIGLNILAVPCCALFVLVWSWHSLTSLGEMPKTGTLSLWTDIFIHATTILQYGDFSTVGRSSFEFVNAARPLYHYGSYMLPALLFSSIDISGLQAAVALHLPIGLLAMFAGTYALARQIASPLFPQVAGFLSICLLFIAPDTSTYGLANGWFGVRWMLMSSPGSSYAIAGTLLSLIFLKIWMDLRNRVALLAAAAFAAMIFQLRAHMLLWYLPVLMLFVAIGNGAWPHSLRKYAGICLVAFIGALAFANVGRYVLFVHLDNVPVGYPGLYPALIGVLGEALAAPIGFLLLYPGMLGALVIAYPFLLFLARSDKHLHRLHWFPLVLAGVAGLFIIWVPASSSGDQFEFKHRAFVLLYVTTLIWTCDLAVKVAYRGFSVSVANCIIYLPVFACAFFAFLRPLDFLTADRPKFLWGQQYVDTRVSKDMIAVADFARRHALRNDVVVIAPVDVKARAADDATRFVSIANIPSYLARFTMWSLPLAQTRLVVVNTIISQPTLAQAGALMRANGMRWLVFADNSPPVFDIDFSSATFKKGGWTIYRFD